MTKHFLATSMNITELHQVLSILYAAFTSLPSSGRIKRDLYATKKFWLNKDKLRLETGALPYVHASTDELVNYTVNFACAWCSTARWTQLRSVLRAFPKLYRWLYAAITLRQENYTVSRQTDRQENSQWIYRNCAPLIEKPGGGDNKIELRGRLNIIRDE